MPPEQDAIPTKPEVGRQLERMLVNEIFASRPQQAKLLDCIVRGVLAGDEITEKYVRAKLFPSPPYKPESNIARRTADLVRDLLDEYYAGDGKDDLVIISLPQSPKGKRIKFLAGKAYAPLFSYNSRHQVAKEYILGNHYLHRGSLQGLNQAVEHFNKVLALEPNHAGARLGLAEALCCHVGYAKDPRVHQLIATADHLITEAMQLAPDHWRTHATRGAFFFVTGRAELAKNEFDIALKLDHLKTASYGFYTLFVQMTGREDEGLQLMRSYVDDHLDDAQAYATYGSQLYKAHRFDEAERVLKDALKIDRNCDLAHFTLMFLYATTDRKDTAQEHAYRLEFLREPGEAEYFIRLLKLKVTEK